MDPGESYCAGQHCKTSMTMITISSTHYGSTPGARRVQTQTPRGARVQNREFCTAHRKESSYLTAELR